MKRTSQRKQRPPMLHDTGVSYCLTHNGILDCGEVRCDNSYRPSLMDADQLDADGAPFPCVASPMYTLDPIADR